MANTKIGLHPNIANMVYKEYIPKTSLVKTCDFSLASDFSLENNQCTIQVYGWSTIHLSSIDENELQPAPGERLQGSTITVVIKKLRYSHTLARDIDKLFDSMSREDSEQTKKLVQSWAIHAEEELACALTRLPAKQTIDFTNATTLPAVGGGTAGVLDKNSINRVIRTLIGISKQNHMSADDFELIVSENFRQIAREALLDIHSETAANAFIDGYKRELVGGINFVAHDIQALVTRDNDTRIPTAEIAFWKARDGVQYVTAYKETKTYVVDADKIVLGQAYGAIQAEHYDFFCLYPTRIYKVLLAYEAGVTPTLIVDNLMFPEVKDAKLGTILG